MVASDRISVFDFVLDTTIPDKGEILTRMSLWWFEQLAGVVDNHVLSTDVPESVRGRAVVCQRLEMVPVECVVRGYLTGTGLLDYRATGAVCGIELPAGLEDGSRLPVPVFTPATKAELGDHDENVSYDAVAATVGAETAAQLRELTLAVYRRAESPGPRARDHPGRHQAGVRGLDGLGPRRSRSDGARRRGAHAGLVALLARSRVAAGPIPNRRTTSRSCGTGRSRRSPAGTGPAVSRLRRCRPRSSSAHGAGTSRPSSCSPGSVGDPHSRSRLRFPLRSPSTTSSTRATVPPGSPACAGWKRSTASRGSVRRGST